MALIIQYYRYLQVRNRCVIYLDLILNFPFTSGRCKLQYIVRYQLTIVLLSLCRKVDILNVPEEVMNDDDMAAAAAAAANGRPAYCTDRYYRALAGGQYCKWEDLRK